jgi:hypothetical protein
MSSASSRALPWPDDLRLGNTGLMLVEGSLIAKKTQTLENVAPTEQQYDSAPVYKERTFAFRPTRGMGERVQSSHTSRRYPFGLNVWVIGGLFGKGPLTHSISPASTGSVTDFVDALHGGVLTQFILAGQYVLRRSDDTNAGQVVSFDAGSSRTVTSAVRYRGAYASPIDGLYVATDNGILRQYDGALWNTATLPAGFLPSLLEVLNDELWLADTTNSTIRKVTADPLLAAGYSASILIGNPAVPITAMRQTNSLLAIFKADGSVYTVNTDGSVNDLFPGIRVPIDTSNGKTAQAWLDSLFFRMGPSLYQLQLTSPPVLTPIGPERMLGNASEVSGPVQAFSGYGTMGAFTAVYSTAGNSYLLTYGNWLPPNEVQAQQNATYQFVDQYDGALVKWAGKKVSAMRVSGIANLDTRLYVGFTDGTWDWLKLVPNPLAPNSGAEFTQQASKMYVPLHHAMFQADWKSTNGFSAFGPTLTSTDYVQIGYRMDGSMAAYTALAGSFMAPGVRLDTPPTTIGHVLDIEITLINSTTSDTPIIDGIAIHESVRPKIKLDYSGSIDARSHVGRRDSSTSRLTAEQIHEAVLQAAGAPTAVTLTLPNETVQNLSFFQYQETLLPRNERNGLGWRIDFAATEFKTETVHGTFGRFKGVTYGDLAGVTFAQTQTW